MFFLFHTHTHTRAHTRTHTHTHTHTLNASILMTYFVLEVGVRVVEGCDGDWLEVILLLRVEVNVSEYSVSS